jgi:ribosomal-protein-alanine N-acetyltransferase
MATAPEAFGRTRWRFRPMTAADVMDVVELEQACYRFPWSEQVFRDCLRVGYDCWVVDSDDVVSGYGIMSMGAGECHILNLCIDPALRRRGAGRALLVALLRRARDAGMEHAFLEVRPSNPAAIALYRSLGFEPIGVRRGYYQAEGGREDALVLRLDLARLPGS